MKKRDRIIVVVIVILSLAVGLGLVYRGLNTAEHSREKLIHDMWTQRDEVSEEGSAAAEADPFHDPEALNSEEATDPEDTSGETNGDLSDPAQNDGDGQWDGDPAATDDPAGTGSGSTDNANGDFMQDEEDPSGENETGLDDGSGQDVGDNGGSGLPSSSGGPLVQPDFGAPPVLDASALTTEELVDWMTTASAGAIEAETSLERERAVAGGKGSENDPDRRAFAQTQYEPNYRARLNALEEEAVRLALDYLRTRDALEIQRADLAFYEGIVQKLHEEQEAAGTDEEVKAFLLKDEEKLKERLDSSRLAAKDALVAHQAAAEALCAATGNDVSAEIQVLGDLAAVPSPGLTADESVAQAMEQRNEINSARYNIIRAQKNLTELRYEFAPGSPEITAQEAELARAQAEYPTARNKIEAQLREALSRMALSEQKQASQREQVSQLPEENPVYILKKEKKEVGEDDGKKEITVCTSNMDELLGGWSKGTQIRLQLVNEVAQYNLSVVQLKHAVSVGCVPALI